MTRCQITIRTSPSAFKEIDFIFLDKRGFDSYGVWLKDRDLLRNTKKWGIEKEAGQEEEALDKMRRWEVIAFIIEKRGKTSRREGGRRYGREILKSKHAALKGHLLNLCSCICLLWLNKAVLCTPAWRPFLYVCFNNCAIQCLLDCSAFALFQVLTQTDLSVQVKLKYSPQKCKIVFTWEKQKWNKHLCQRQQLQSDLCVSFIFISLVSLIPENLCG